MIKAVIISDTDESRFEKKITDLLNGNDVWHDDFGELVDISYAFNREGGFYETILHTALITYKTKERRR